MEVLNDINHMQLQGKRIRYFRVSRRKIRNPRTGQVERYETNSSWVLGIINRVVGNKLFGITLHVLAKDGILTLVPYTLERMSMGFEVLPDV